MRLILGLVTALASLVAGGLCAHTLNHSAGTGDAVIVELRYADGLPFSYESAEVYRPGEAVPFLAGRTDANGRLAFVPDRSGDWRVRAFSEDGHGGDFTVAATPDGASTAPSTGLGTVTRVAVGLSIIFGLFGIWSVFIRRKS